MTFVKNRLLFAIIILFISTSAVAQSTDEHMIKELMAKELEYWNAGNIEAYVDLYAPLDSVRMLYNGGAVYGKENLLAFYKKHWPKDRMGKLAFTDVRLERISSEYYFASGHFHLSYPDKETQKGRFSGLMKKINGKWYMYTDHSG